MHCTDPISVFLCGDVMTGRGIDQVLPHPGNPVLYEACMEDAREYVQLAEAANGPIPQPVGLRYVWGDALEELERAGTDLRIVNLETSITVSENAWPGKGIHYRMHPANIGSLTEARLAACSLANNHVMDWGREGLEETLKTLECAGISYAGAGGTVDDARSPAVLGVPGKGRVLLFAMGTADSGIPEEWAAMKDRSGVWLLPNLSDRTARRVAVEMRAYYEPGDILIASIHWGGNWGYRIPSGQIRFAHRLIDEGVDLIHGHSAHHPKPLEIYRERLILYGCGDFINDYEGISGHEKFRSDLRLMVLVRLAPGDGKVVETALIPMQVRKFRLHRATEADIHRLYELLSQWCARFGMALHLGNPGQIAVEQAQSVAGSSWEQQKR